MQNSNEELIFLKKGILDKNENEIVSKIATAKKVYYEFDSKSFKSIMGVDFDTLYVDYDSKFKSYLRFNYKGFLEHEIDEIVGNVWDRIMYHYTKYDNSYTLSTWMYTVCINTANLYLNSANKRRLRYVQGDKFMLKLRKMSSYRFNPFNDEANYKEDKKNKIVKIVKDAIDKIENEDCRQIMKMWVTEGMTLNEISEETGINLSTIKARVSRSKEILKNMIKEDARDLLID
jgi:RNA polymerase sigma factor (sigma-70 family)